MAKTKKVKKTARLVIPIEPWLLAHLQASTKQNKTAAFGHQAVIEKMKRRGLLAVDQDRGCLVPAYKGKPKA